MPKDLIELATNGLRFIESKESGKIMTKLVSSICVSPSREKARIAKMESERLSALSQLIAEIPAMASAMGISFAASREAIVNALAKSQALEKRESFSEVRESIYRMLDQPESFEPVSADVAKCKWFKFPKPNSVVFDPPLVWTHPSDTINRPSDKR